MSSKATKRRNSNSGLAVKRLANYRRWHREILRTQKAYNAYTNARIDGELAESQPPQPIAQSTPFERVRDCVQDVLQLENRVAAIANKLLGFGPEPVGDEKARSQVSAPIFELNEHASDITAAVRRMHEVLDRFNPVLPA